MKYTTYVARHPLGVWFAWLPSGVCSNVEVISKVETIVHKVRCEPTIRSLGCVASIRCACSKCASGMCSNKYGTQSAMRAIHMKSGLRGFYQACVEI